MEQSKQTTTAEPPEQTINGSELVRPQEGRVLAGVSQGLANRYQLPVWVPRAFFVVCAFFGGLGVALYAAARFVIELYRGDPRGFLFEGALSTSQFIGSLLLAVSLFALFVLRKRPRPKMA